MDLIEAQNLAVQAAKVAGEHILSGYTQELTIALKTDPADRLTQFDGSSQQIILDALWSKYPDHEYLCEEKSASSDANSEYRRVIDPLDGTMNFTQRLPHVGVSIALEKNGEVVLSVVYLPVLDEMYTALKDQGAYKNDVRIHASSCEDCSKAVASEFFSDREARGKNITYPPVTAYRKLGSAVCPLVYTADGRFDACAVRCMWWDCAACSLILKEAGAEVTITYDDPGSDGPLTIVASAPGIHEEVCEFVNI